MKVYLEFLEEAGVVLPDKEAAKMKKMSDDEGNIDKMEFMVYAKKSPTFRMLVTEGEGQPCKDKAEIAFKVCVLVIMVFWSRSRCVLSAIHEILHIEL